MSARFQGNFDLESILHDPDTGSMFLWDNSPFDAVFAVQQALADLRWPSEVVPPLALDTFVDGDFGEGTAKAVSAYRHCFRVVAPHDGSIDGRVTPRTLWLLDKHMTWFDLLTDEVGFAVESLEAAGSVVELGDVTKAIRQGALKRNVVVDGVSGAIVAAIGRSPRLVRSPILEAYLDRVRSFGAPLDDERDGPDGTREMEFEFGTLRHDPSTGSVVRIDDEILPDLVF